LFFLAGESGVRNSPCSALAGLPTTSRVAARLDAAAHEAILTESIFGARKQRRGEKTMTMLAFSGIAIAAGRKLRP